jgi:hypothetical protein
MKLLLTLLILVVLLQLLGVAAYFILLKSSVYRAHLAGALTPPLAFFVLFLALFLWRYYHPGPMGLIEGRVNLIILVTSVVGTTLHLTGGAVLYYVLYRRRG